MTKIEQRSVARSSNRAFLIPLQHCTTYQFVLWTVCRGETVFTHESHNLIVRRS